MPDDEPSGLSGADIVGQFGKETRNAIAEAVTSATADVVQRIVRWCIATIILTMAGAGIVTWLVMSLIQSKEAGIQFRVQYGDTVASCARGVDLAGGTPVVVCNPVLR